MASDPTRPSISSFQAQAELELLQLILNQDDAPVYPWNPTDARSDVYFADLEQQIADTDWFMEEVGVRSQALAATVDAIWATFPTPATTTTSLFQQFTDLVPGNILDRIMERARETVQSNLSLADQMVACVRELLPNWGDDDLQVLARPFAYAMRDSNTELLEGALRSLRCAAWTELSGVEQARLSLAIARFAIAQTPASEHPSEH